MMVAKHMRSRKGKVYHYQTVLLKADDAGKLEAVARRVHLEPREWVRMMIRREFAHMTEVCTDGSQLAPTTP